VETLRAALTEYQNALQVRTKESLPQAWAETQNNLGNSYVAVGERLKGDEAIESLRAAVAAFHNALQVYAKDSFPTLWAGTQNNLGNAYRKLGELLSGPEAEENLRAAVAACQDALQVRTRESFPDAWAEVQNTLARAYVSQQRWEEAAHATENVLAVVPTSVEALVRAERIYQDRLFRFDRAFEMNAKRLELGDGKFDFIEVNLTTARFEDCASRAATAEREIKDSSQRLVMTALRFACLAAGGKKEEGREVWRQLVNDLSALGQIRWTFRGVKHYVTKHPAFATQSADWIRLFEALEQGDRAQAGAALAALQLTQ
jgi:tetratricopeptide (TPR) repeat protein